MSKHWTPLSKFDVVKQFIGGADACKLSKEYDVPIGELLGWVLAFKKSGLRGLYVTSKGRQTRRHTNIVYPRT